MVVCSNQVLPQQTVPEDVLVVRPARITREGTQDGLINVAHLKLVKYVVIHIEMITQIFLY